MRRHSSSNQNLTGGRLIIPALTPVNAVAAFIGLTVTSRPDDYVANVQSKKVLTVASQPNTLLHAGGTITVSGTPQVVVLNSYAGGDITVTGTPSVDETLLVGAQTFAFKAARGGAGEIAISADNTTQAENIVTAITADLATVAATNLLGVVHVSANAAGAAGNAIDFEAAATGIAVTGTGHLLGGVDAIAGDTFVVDTVTFTFKTARAGAGDVAVGGTPAATALNIKNAVNADVATVAATSLNGVVTLMAVAGGVAGNALTLTENATGVAVSAGGTLANGQDADTLILDATTYTFIANGVAPAALEIAIGTTVNNTAAAIAAKTPPATVVLTANLATVTVEAVALGTAGDGITVTSDNARITGAGVTAGGVDLVRSYITVNGKNYTFCATGGDVPTVAYPTDIPVETAGGANMTAIAAALVVKLKLDTATFTAASVANVNADITATFKTRGTIGNAATYVNHLVVAGDITDTGVVAGKFTSGVDGTPGYQFQLVADVDHIHLCKTTDLTTTNNYWVVIS